MISGVSVFKGIVFGKALLFKNNKIIVNKNNIFKNNINSEIKNFLIGRDKTIKEIKKIIDINKRKLSQNKIDIFESHIMLLEDYELEKEVINLIKNKLITADYAISKIIKKQIKKLKKIKNKYFNERINDILDISERLLKNTLKLNIDILNNINDKVIIVSKELTPSETVQLNLKNVLGFITEFGSITSHTSIMARSLELPSIVNVYNITNKIKTNDYLILDAINNNIYINPDSYTIKVMKEKKKKFKNEIKKLKKIKKLYAITTDGYKVSMLSNICNFKDISNVKKYGSEGIGLYRTEFLFMNRNSLPNVNEQYKLYKYISKKIKNKKIVIRTMDIGGDKNVNYLNIPKEENPYLGWRAIRIAMDIKKVLYDQLKAILLASKNKNIHILFPMITFIEEIKFLKYELKNIIKKLIIIKKKINKKIKIGIMIETPSSSLIVNDIIKEIDFLSIGTNDLTQYTLSVDRGNKLVSHLYNSISPSVLKLIKKITKEAYKQNKHISICGELASYENSTLLLLGMGLEEFSMNSNCIPYIKNIIIKNTFKNAVKIARLALKQKFQKKI
ncbi:MAG: phosphoenolpyruvate--protein phosphotransferase [Enterobacteriaceae bacterium]